MLFTKKKGSLAKGSTYTWYSSFFLYFFYSKNFRTNKKKVYKRNIIIQKGINKCTKYTYQWNWYTYVYNKGNKNLTLFRNLSIKYVKKKNNNKIVTLLKLSFKYAC